jgi:hypothetical protein
MGWFPPTSNTPAYFVSASVIEEKKKFNDVDTRAMNTDGNRCFLC